MSNVRPHDTRLSHLPPPMNSDQFVAALVEHVHEPAIQGVISQLESPSGRRPPAKNVQLSEWYAQLNEQDRTNLHAVVGRSVHAALFGALCAIDGVRALQDGSTGHEFQLLSVEQGNVERLNRPDDESLHDIYQGIVYPLLFE